MRRRISQYRMNSTQWFDDYLWSCGICDLRYNNSEFYDLRSRNSAMTGLGENMMVRWRDAAIQVAEIAHRNILLRPSIQEKLSVNQNLARTLKINLMNVRQSVNEGHFYVFQRVSSRWVALFYTFIEFRAFRVNIYCHYSFPLLELQEWKAGNNMKQCAGNI